MGQQFHVTADGLPAPGATPSIDASAKTVPRGKRRPLAPAGFTVTLMVEGLAGPRRLLVADDLGDTIWRVAPPKG